MPQAFALELYARRGPKPKGTPLSTEALTIEAIGAGSIRQQDGQVSIFEDVLSCAAEEHLPQPALCIGTLD